MESDSTNVSSNDPIVAIGGTVDGILFGSSRRKSRLTWGFTFECAGTGGEHFDYDRIFSIRVESIPLSIKSWSDLARAKATCVEFGDPMEATVYVGWHGRYDQAMIEVISQKGTKLAVRASLEGDVDGIGRDRIEVEGELDFQGIYVHLNRKPKARRARRALKRHTDPAGLIPKDRGLNWIYHPVIATASPRHHET